MAGRIVGFQRCPLPNCGTCEDIALYGERNFPDVVKDVYVGGAGPGSSMWAQCLYESEAGGSESET